MSDDIVREIAQATVFSIAQVEAIARELDNEITRLQKFGINVSIDRSAALRVLVDKRSAGIPISAEALVSIALAN